MKHLFNSSLIAFFLWNLFTVTLEAKPSDEERKKHMIEDLQVIKHTFEVGYAPTEWKKSYSNWDLEQEFEKAKQRVLDLSPLTVKDFQIIVRDFLNSTQDYHVNVCFFSTESATLPFSVKSVNDRYFIDWIDPLLLHPKVYDIRIGDELLEFCGRPIKNVIADLKANANKNANPNTDQALADMALTNRQGMAGDRVPKGTISITTRSVSKGMVHSYQLMWKYESELIKSPFDLNLTQSLAFLKPEESQLLKLPKKEMMSSFHHLYSKKMDRDGALGAKKSFVPPLGSIIWTNEEGEAKDKESDNESKDSFWHAYIYKNAQNQKIGYIRIPHYVAEKDEGNEFGSIMNFFQDKTDALVIDQVHNYGGYVTFQYDIASILASNPLKTPKHRLKITQQEVMMAYQFIALIDTLSFFVEADILNGDEEDNDILDYQYLLFLKDFYQFTIDEWNAGRPFTNPIHLEGVDWINPHPHFHYTKPILMLINELDFSGGDFMPAIMQDNKRATLFGTRTAGAGGFVNSSAFPNDNGIASFSYTGSIAERIDLKKIENLGVSPDIEYQLTEDDVQYGYKSYVSAVNQAIQRLLQQQTLEIQ